jgi:hemoglobin-like flavoprotein
MTPDQVKLVQQSFEKVAPISETAAVLFYDRLFDIAPKVRSMFPTDMTEQRRKLMATLAVVVNGLGNLESVLPAASALAKRSTIRWSARRCCGRWRRDWEMAGPPKSRKPGPRPMGRCPAS